LERLLFLAVEAQQAFTLRRALELRGQVRSQMDEFGNGRQPFFIPECSVEIIHF
jgi:hypothetical protein